MSKVEDLWLESRTRVCIEQCCAENGWKFTVNGWDYDIYVTDTSRTFHAEWARHRGKALVSITLTFLGGIHRLGPFPTEVLQFALRRNAQLAGMHWCIARFEGLAVRAVRLLDELTAASFQEAVTDLVAEWRDLVDLLEKGVEKEKAGGEAGGPC